MSSKCPPVTLNVDAVVDAAAEKVLAKCPSMKAIEADVHSVGVRGLGKIALVEQNVKPDQFVMGFITIPTVVNFATKLMEIGLILPKADMAVSRGVAAGLTLVGTLVSGGKSFLLGAFLGQFPSTLDAIADLAIAQIAKMKAVVPPAPAGASDAGVAGLGNAEEELQQLKQDLQKLNGLGTDEQYENAMAGREVRFHH